VEFLQVEFGTVKQAQDAFMMLRYSLFVIANRTDEFSSFATGHIHNRCTLDLATTQEKEQATQHQEYETLNHPHPKTLHPLAWLVTQPRKKRDKPPCTQQSEIRHVRTS
jgi:hypothetical protein